VYKLSFQLRSYSFFYSCQPFRLRRGFGGQACHQQTVSQTCHSEAEPKNLYGHIETLHCAQDDMKGAHVQEYLHVLVRQLGHSAIGTGVTGRLNLQAESEIGEKWDSRMNGGGGGTNGRHPVRRKMDEEKAKQASEADGRRAKP
jgi:hypothetical protein